MLNDYDEITVCKCPICGDTYILDDRDMPYIQSIRTCKKDYNFQKVCDIAIDFHKWAVALTKCWKCGNLYQRLNNIYTMDRFVFNALKSLNPK